MNIQNVSTGGGAFITINSSTEYIGSSDPSLSLLNAKFSNISNVTVLLNFTGSKSYVIINNVSFENMNIAKFLFYIEGAKIDLQNISYQNVTFETCWGVILNDVFGKIKNFDLNIKNWDLNCKDFDI